MMKKFITYLIFCLFISCTSVYAAPPVFMQPTATSTTSETVIQGSGLLYSIWIKTDGTNNITFDAYDHKTRASGLKLFPTRVVIPGDDVSEIINFNPPLRYLNGVTIDLTTAGTVAYKCYFARD